MLRSLVRLNIGLLLHDARKERKGSDEKIFVFSGLDRPTPTPELIGSSHLAGLGVHLLHLHLAGLGVHLLHLHLAGLGVHLLHLLHLLHLAGLGVRLLHLQGWRSARRYLPKLEILTER